MYELDGAEYVSSGVAPLDANVPADMVGVAEGILHDYRHGFVRVDDEGAVQGLRVSAVLWVMVVRWVLPLLRCTKANSTVRY